jgi:UDP-glucose 6-dehydrogenase
MKITIIGCGYFAFLTGAFFSEVGIELMYADNE